MRSPSLGQFQESVDTLPKELGHGVSNFKGCNLSIGYKEKRTVKDGQEAYITATKRSLCRHWTRNRESSLTFLYEPPLRVVGEGCQGS